MMDIMFVGLMGSIAIALVIAFFWPNDYKDAPVQAITASLSPIVVAGFVVAIGNASPNNPEPCNDGMSTGQYMARFVAVEEDEAVVTRTTIEEDGNKEVSCYTESLDNFADEPEISTQPQMVEVVEGEPEKVIRFPKE